MCAFSFTVTKILPHSSHIKKIVLFLCVYSFCLLFMNSEGKYTPTKIKRNTQLNHIFILKKSTFCGILYSMKWRLTQSASTTRKRFLLSEVVFFSPLYFVCKCLWSVYADGIVWLQPQCSKVRLCSPWESEQRAVDQQCFAEYLVTIKTAETKWPFDGNKKIE